MGAVKEADLVRIEHVLQELSQRMRETADRSGTARDDPSGPAAPESRAADPDMPLALAKSWVEAHRARNRIFGADLFSDPAWSLLLQLYLDGKAKRSCSVSSLCVSANLAQSTGLRWVLALEKAGDVTRRIDPLDRRKTAVALTSVGIERMERALT